MTDTQYRGAIGIKRKGDDKFKIRTGKKPVADPDTPPPAHIIHRRSGIARCSVCGSTLQNRCLPCQNCGAGNE